MSTLILFLPPGRPGPATEYSYTLTADGHHATRHASAPPAPPPRPPPPAGAGGGAGARCAGRGEGGGGGVGGVAVVGGRALSWQRLLLPPGLPLGAGQQTPR